VRLDTMNWNRLNGSSQQPETEAAPTFPSSCVSYEIGICPMANCWILLVAIY
jgi:hypothetical protein